jgi:predicted ATPase/class 3 adenylate cyclase
MEASDRAVTHVFADIEGSTRLWEEAPDKMRVALARHDVLARTVVADRGGRMVKSTGDGWYAVFDDALQAAQAAVHFQLGLYGIAAESGLAFVARCGLHAGPAEWRDSDYFGPSVNRAARIMAAAHGGQILLGETVVADLAGRVPEACALRELGRVRLRDLAGATNVYQLQHPGLRSSFPPLRGLDSTPNNLPIVQTPLVGRFGVLSELTGLVRSHRLVTIMGTGGLGKTRVAMQLAADMLDGFEDGAWFVDLAPLDDATRVPALLASAMGVAEKADEGIVDTLVVHLGSRHALVVVDNCEHLVDAVAALVEALLRRTPGTHVIATSREALHVDGEKTYALPALALPAVEAPTASEALHSTAVALFVERARQHRATFVLDDETAPTVTRICRALDGIPLAIELAAARLRSMALDELEQRLNDRFRLLTQGHRTALPRHRTLEALVAWSCNLLDPSERVIFNALGVFAGGFDLEAAEAVATPSSAIDVATGVASLVDKSLVVVEASPCGGRLRYRLLETLREFALRELAAESEGIATRRRHADHYARRLHDLPPESAGDARGRYLERLDGEIDNLRAAVAFRLGDNADPDATVELVGDFEDFCGLRGHLALAARTVGQALLTPLGATPSLLRFRLLRSASYLAIRQARLEDARRHAERALEDSRAFGTPTDIANASQGLAQIAGWQMDFERADQLFNEALAAYRSAGRLLDVAKTLCNLATCASQGCRFEAARDYGLQAVAAARAIGALRVEAYAENALGGVNIETGDAASARSHYERAVVLARRIGDQWAEDISRGGIAQAALALGQVDEAHALLLVVLERFAADDLVRETAMALDDVAHALALRDQPLVAAPLFAAADRARSSSSLALSTTERTQLDERISRARLAAGAAPFECAWNIGQSLSLDEAIRLARETPLRPAVAGQGEKTHIPREAHSG